MPGKKLLLTIEYSISEARQLIVNLQTAVKDRTFIIPILAKQYTKLQQKPILVQQHAMHQISIVVYIELHRATLHIQLIEDPQCTHTFI